MFVTRKAVFPIARPALMNSSGDPPVYFSLSGDILRETADYGALSAALDPRGFQEAQTAFDARIDDILVALLPQKAQLMQRMEVRNFAAIEISKVLRVQAVDVGHYRLRCFLPDEPIQLGIPVPPEQLGGAWHQELYLWFAQMSPPDRTRNSVTSSSGGGGGLSDQRSRLLPVVTNVSVSPSAAAPSVESSPEETSWRLQCAVDSVNVEMSALSKSDLCIVAFHEEMDHMIGRDHLFKRSVILLKAWWMYEAVASVGSGVNYSLPSVWMLCVLLSAVFNKYYRHIYHPLHALLLFFSEYSQFDWKKNAATLNGPISKSEYMVYASGLSDEVPSKLKGAEGLEFAPLIRPDIVAKYNELSQNGPSGRSPDMRPSSSSFSSSSGSAARSVSVGQDFMFVSDNSSGGLLVVHPFLPKVILRCESTDADQSFFVTALKAGLVLISDMIKSRIDGQITLTPQEAVDHYFTGTITRFGCRNKRADQPGYMPFRRGSRRTSRSEVTWSDMAPLSESVDEASDRGSKRLSEDDPILHTAAVKSR
jgi:hypothetical protein